MLIPVLHRLIVKPRQLEEVNDTYKKMRELGLAVPESQQKKREEQAVEMADVIAIGDTAFKDFKADLVPHVGDTVYFAKYAGKQVTDKDGTTYLVLNDEDIVAIVKE